MKRLSRRGIAKGKVIVILALSATAAFAIFLGYMAWTYDSFPSQERPFSTYANVVSARFNGTEYAFKIQWLSADFVPEYAQITSPVSDSANSPVCGLNLSAATQGQIIFMPFGISSPSTSLSDVELNIAVSSTLNGTQFTIVYNVDAVTAVPGNILPSNFSCTEPSVPM